MGNSDVDPGIEARVLARLDGDRIARDVSALVPQPSVTGSERAALDLLASLAERHGLQASLEAYDLAALRRHAAYPGEEAPRDELLGVVARLPGSGARRLCLNGHIDVITPGTEPWRDDPFSGVIRDGRVYGRGSLDMKSGLIAALHAIAAVRDVVGDPVAEITLQAVSSEEDGGVGTFAALERDSRFDACLIPEPTGFTVVTAQAGALTFNGRIRGRSAHAAVRLRGVSAIDRYMPVHHALAQYERRLNAEVTHPMMTELELPYPLLVGIVRAGTWSSQVPDELVFEGRVGVPIGLDIEEARASFEAVVAGADDGHGPPAEISWTGGQFGSGETPVADPFVGLVGGVAGAELAGAAPVAGVPYGSDMRLFCARGIPCVMFGVPGLERAHATDEYVEIDDVTRLSRVIARLILRFGRD